MAYQSEIEKLEQRYRENPDQWFAALADSYRKAGSLDLALDVVRAGLEKRPNYVSGYIVLGRCLLQKPDDGAATGAFEKVLALDAENVIALKALSEIAERAGRLDDATRWLARLLEVDPMNEEAEQALARLKEAPAAAVAPAEGVEATMAEMPAVGEPGRGALAAEAPAAPPEEFVLEKSEEATVGGTGMELLELEGPAPRPEASAAAPPAGPEAPTGPTPDLEPMEFEAPAGAGVPLAEGVESLEFQPPPPGETPPAPDLEPMEFTAPPAGSAEAGAGSGAPVAEPFDDQLAWGTGQRLSGQVSQQDVAAAEHAHDEAVAPVGDVAGSEPPGGGATSEAGSGDLPLIFPDEPAAKGEEPGRDGEPPAGADAAPVMTETMAELYVKQGLIAEAREIYRALVAQRPGDAALADRLTALEATPGAVAGRLSRPVVTAAETGGPSVRDFLSQVFGGAPAPPVPPAPLPAPEAPAAEPAALESALAESREGAVGAPTRRASDEMSLAAVFGEEPVPAAPSARGEEPPKSGGASFSFDEFFGSQGKRPESRPSTRSAASRSEEDEDDFKRWLKGLKS
jgi:tetratricopeptide (TPR) repeat protein